MEGDDRSGVGPEPWLMAEHLLASRRSKQRRVIAREVRAHWGSTGLKMYADWRAPVLPGGSETAFVEQHEEVVGAP